MTRRIGRWDADHPPNAAEVRALRRELVKRKVARLEEARRAQARETAEERERRERAKLEGFVAEFERNGRI